MTRVLSRWWHASPRRGRAALLAALFPLSALAGDAAGWPFFVAPEGCRFEWEGPGGYRETAFSHGRAAFPTILFSRTDWGPKVFPFVPICGGLCRTPDGKDALRALFPLEVGKKAGFAHRGRAVRMEVLGREVFAALHGLEAFHIRTSLSPGGVFDSWWAPELGWLAKFDDGRQEKTVVRVSCPDGPNLPGPAV